MTHLRTSLMTRSIPESGSTSSGSFTRRLPSGAFLTFLIVVASATVPVFGAGWSWTRADDYCARTKGPGWCAAADKNGNMITEDIMKGGLLIEVPKCSRALGKSPSGSTGFDSGLPIAERVKLSQANGAVSTKKEFDKLPAAKVADFPRADASKSNKTERK